MFFKKIISLVLLLVLSGVPSFADENVYSSQKSDIQVVETTQEPKYTDYSKMYTGDDKYEKFNRKMFNLNTKLNKFVARPVHIIWSSVMPKFGIDRIRDAYNNIEYPKRLASCILQRDGKGAKIETMRFLTNTTLGLGGLFDPADKILKIKPTNENMEQALCKCKVNSGSYLVVPVLNSCTPRSLCGRALEAVLDPSVYLASPLTSAIKFGLMLNRTSYMQPLAHMIETTYADPYDIHKKLFGMENYIRNHNLDRENLFAEKMQDNKENATKDLIAQKDDDIATGFSADIKDNLNDILPLGENALKADLILDNYNPQTPVLDSMRTAFFDDKSINKSIWNELSIWNRSFARRVKTGSIMLTDGKPEYKYKYIMQKDKNSPLVIIYPSIGESAGTHHSIVFAKMFFDNGYSVLMPSSHFHWEFAQSMPDGYSPGLPETDSEKLQEATLKIVNNLQNKYNCEFKNKTIIGTSFGAMEALYVANRENIEPKLYVNKFIAISPPIDLWYAISQLDKNSEDFDKNSDEVKQKTALTAAKILQMYEKMDSGENLPEMMPFSDEEGKLITTFILRQKLSDLIFTLDKTPKNQKTDIYEKINNMSYKDYAEAYIGLNQNSEFDVENNKNSFKTNLYEISEYLSNNDNYVIFESFDDYFINKEQLSKLKNIAGEKLKCLNCGAHLGYLYRKEFLTKLMEEFKKG
ncbi:MAG: VacJ family lipoprotein [bacterium]|nr:VacJ family lipoprotein [bacterium]